MVTCSPAVHVGPPGPYLQPLKLLVAKNCLMVTCSPASHVGPPGPSLQPLKLLVAKIA
jgi:hypothetical protein